MSEKRVRQKKTIFKLFIGGKFYIKINANLIKNLSFKQMQSNYFN